MLYKKELHEWEVKKISLFGSVAKNLATRRSDVDILIEFDSAKSLFFFIRTRDYLEKILNCDVDLVTKAALHPGLKTQILREARRVF